MANDHKWLVAATGGYDQQSCTTAIDAFPLIEMAAVSLMQILTELEEILHEYRDAKVLSLTSRLHHDLGIDGDDAIELLEKVSAAFGTDFSDLNYGEFFADESEALSYWLTSLIGWKSDKKAFTISHLAQVVERGKWFEPVAPEPPSDTR